MPMSNGEGSVGCSGGSRAKNRGLQRVIRAEGVWSFGHQNIMAFSLQHLYAT